MKQNRQFILSTFLICVTLFLTFCASTKPEIPQKQENAYIDKDLEALTA